MLYWDWAVDVIWIWINVAARTSRICSVLILLVGFAIAITGIEVGMMLEVGVVAAAGVVVAGVVSVEVVAAIAVDDAKLPIGKSSARESVVKTGCGAAVVVEVASVICVIVTLGNKEGLTRMFARMFAFEYGFARLLLKIEKPTTRT